MEALSLGEILHSESNRFFLRLRRLLRFSRGGYAESGLPAPGLSQAERALEEKYAFAPYRGRLKPSIYRVNLFTLWLLDRLLAELPPLAGALEALEALEPGCQDFARLPALRAFLENKLKGGVQRITGIELDPYPLLHDFRSRWDRAQYYLSLSGYADRYLAGDFFEWQQPAHLIFCFYPFVSPHPALAWGLPATFGNPLAWAEAFARNLLPGGLLLVVHQGDWEEAEFDRCRVALGLKLLRRQQLLCPFHPLPHPACASVYQRA